MQRLTILFLVALLGLGMHPLWAQGSDSQSEARNATYTITYLEMAGEANLTNPYTATAQEGATITLTLPEYGYAHTNGFVIFGTDDYSFVEPTGETFVMPPFDVTVTFFLELTEPVMQVKVNGEVMTTMAAGTESIDLTPYEPATSLIPGFEFVGWMQVDTEDGIYYSASEMPETQLLGSTFEPGADPDLFTVVDALFCQAGSTTTYLSSKDAPDDGDCIVLDGSWDGYDWGIDAEGQLVALTFDEGYEQIIEPMIGPSGIAHYADEVAWMVESTNGGYTLRHGDVYLSANNNIVGTTTNASNALVFTFTTTEDGWDGYFRTGRKVHLDISDDGFIIRGDNVYQEPNVYVYKRQFHGQHFTTLIQTYYDGDLLFDIAGVSFIAGNVEAEPIANTASESRGLLVIKDGGVLDASYGIYNTYPERLVIEDGGQLIHRYDDDGLQATLLKHVTGYGEGHEGGHNGWQLLSYPILAFDDYDEPIGYPTDGLTSGTFDLYSYDEATRHWLNTKDEEEGKPLDELSTFSGYLYASQDDLDLSFSGPLVSQDDHRYVTLEHSTDEPSYLAGFNLIGNPFSYGIQASDLFFARQTGDGEVYVSPTALYRCNGQNVIVAQNDDATVMPMEAFFVKCEANDDALLFYDPEESYKATVGDLKIEVTGNGEQTLLDRAYVNFGDVTEMDKLMLDEHATRLCLSRGGKDYATLNASHEGSMTLCFKAANDGEYTLTVKAEKCEASYLHLVDKRTGTDVDLLQDGSYTFHATTSDDAERFVVVFQMKR